MAGNSKASRFFCATLHTHTGQQGGQVMERGRLHLFTCQRYGRLLRHQQQGIRKVGDGAGDGRHCGNVQAWAKKEKSFAKQYTQGGPKVTPPHTIHQPRINHPKWSFPPNYYTHYKRGKSDVAWLLLAHPVVAKKVHFAPPPKKPYRFRDSPLHRPPQPWGQPLRRRRMHGKDPMDAQRDEKLGRIRVQGNTLCAIITCGGAGRAYRAIFRPLSPFFLHCFCSSTRAFWSPYCFNEANSSLENWPL